MIDWKNTSVLVTGGSGFLGGALASRLLDEGCRSVAVFCRGEVAGLQSRGAAWFQGDLRDRDALSRACAGRDIVFHTAAKAGVWGPRDEYFQTNVQGTLNVLAAASANKVRALVHTSSPSVAYRAGEDVRGVDESRPLPEGHSAHYPASKAMAEKHVLAANSPSLGTVALRPHLIWGPGDRHLLPRIVRAAARGKIRIVGDGLAKVDLTYIDNAVEAHVRAAEALARSPESVSGRAYFISDGAPVELWPWINGLLARLGLPPVSKKISFRKAWLAGAVLEAAYAILRLPGEPPMTRFVAGQLARSHYFDISAAVGRLGYRPPVDNETGLSRTVRWLLDKNIAGPDE